MAAKKKIVISVAAAAIVLGGGYAIAKTVIGSEAESSINEALAALDEHPAVSVDDIENDRSLFSTSTTATIDVHDQSGLFNGSLTGELALFIDHGLFSQPVTGTLTPDQSVVEGVLEIELLPSKGGVAGTVSSEQLSGVDYDMTVDDLVFNLETSGEGDIDVQATSANVALHEDEGSLILEGLAGEYTQSKDKANSLSISTPLLSIESPSINASVDQLSLSATSEETGEGLATQTGTLDVGNVSARNMTFGGGSLAIEGDRWHLEAMENLQQSLTRYQANDEALAGSPSQSHQAKQRELMTLGIESIYTLLKASPTLSIDPLEANLTLPMMNDPLNPRVVADLSYDGSNLSKGMVYSAFWDSQYEPTEAVTALEGLMRKPDAREAMLGRLAVEAVVSTPPQSLMGMFPIAVSNQINYLADEQTITFMDGELRVNERQIR